MCMSLLIVGCFSPDSSDAKTNTPAKPKQTDSVSVSVDWVNYNHINTFDFTIYDLTVPNAPAIGGGGVNVLDSGGSKSCCVSLPLQWRPGLKVMLKWNEADRDNILGEWKKEYEIPRYEKPGDLFVVFNTDHTVDLVVSPAEPGSPKWAGKIKETPMAKCFSEFGKKECKRWLPNPEADFHDTCLHLQQDADCQQILQFCKAHPDDNHCVQSYDK